MSTIKLGGVAPRHLPAVTLLRLWQWLMYAVAIFARTAKGLAE